MRFWFNTAGFLSVGALLTLGAFAGRASVASGPSHGCELHEAPAPESPSSDAPCLSAASPTDDSGIERRFTKAMERYNATGDVVPRQRLVSQLDRERCEGRFARPSKRELTAEQKAMIAEIEKDEELLDQTGFVDFSKSPPVPPPIPTSATSPAATVAKLLTGC